MVIAAVHRLTNETWRLLHDPSPDGATDLRLQWDSVRRWFGGGPVYGDIMTDNHPPASWLMLWPLLGWPSLETARWLWAIATLPALLALVVWTIVGCEATTPLERIVVGLVPLSMFATSATIGNGQLIIHVLAVLVPAILLLRDSSGPDRRVPANWARELTAVTLFVVAMVKPTLTLPFCCLVVALPWRIRPALLVAVGYAAITFAASAFRDATAVELMLEWLARGTSSAVRGAGTGGYGNLLSWFGRIGLSDFGATAGALLVVAMGAWALFRRRADVWLLMGVCALVARLWTYHRLYDDLLILLPMIALYRVAAAASGPSDRQRVVAGMLLGVTWALSLAPARVLAWPGLPSELLAGASSFAWVADGIFLIGVSTTMPSFDRRESAPQS
jgi:hypothetical protein